MYMLPTHRLTTLSTSLTSMCNGVTVYCIVGFCREDFNLVIGSIRDIKIRDHFIRDILYLTLY